MVTSRLEKKLKSWGIQKWLGKSWWKKVSGNCKRINETLGIFALYSLYLHFLSKTSLCAMLTSYCSYYYGNHNSLSHES